MKDLADRLRHASVDPSAGYFGTLCGFALTEIEALRAQVATLTAELANKSRLFASCDAAHTELTEQYLEVTRELARVKALVAGSQTVGYYVYVSEHQNAYIVEDADEAIDDLTNHGAQITELIARPNLEQKP